MYLKNLTLKFFRTFTIFTDNLFTFAALNPNNFYDIWEIIMQNGRHLLCKWHSKVVFQSVRTYLSSSLMKLLFEITSLAMQRCSSYSREKCLVPPHFLIDMKILSSFPSYSLKEKNESLWQWLQGNGYWKVCAMKLKVTWNTNNFLRLILVLSEYNCIIFFFNY